MNETVRAACVMGWPVAHSRSPLIHGHWLKKYGIKGDYRREPVKPEEFAGFLARLAERGYVGGNITQPLKQLALKLTEPDARASAIGAANTVWYDSGKLRSTNTDVEGFLGSLDVSAPGWDKGLERAVVLGAGGASLAIVYGFLDRGIERVQVVNRTTERAEELKKRFGPRIVPARWDELPGLLKGARLLANATSLGMHGNPDLDIDLSGLAENAVVGDAIYVPLKTTLLQAAERRGLRTSDGLGMLLYQAGRGFSLWFGVRPEVTSELRALVEAELRK
jgi:shikimate dehydrogenase